MNERTPEIDITRMAAGREASSLVAGLIGQLGEASAEPVDALLEGLVGGGGAGADWLSAWTGAEAWAEGLWRRLVAGEVAIEEIEAAKHQAKRAFGMVPGSGPGAVPGAIPGGTPMLAYLVAIAAGLVHHGRLLSSMPADTMQDWLTAVAGAAGPPLDGLLAGAAEVLRDSA